MYATGKVLSPDTLIIDNSPCYPNYHTSKTDIADFHFYAAIPAGSKLWMRFLDLLSSSPKKRNKLLFGPNRPNEGKPTVISEFGAWGLPTISQRGEKPWWFSQGWGPGVPSGMERRFENSGLSSVWKNLEDMERATQRHEFESLKFMIESMRKMPELSGYVITQFYDLHWEANGLLDSQRGKKEDFGDIQKLNADSVLIIDRASTKTNVWSGEGFSVPVVFSNLSSRKMRNCILDWRFGKESGQVKIKLINSFGITAISKIRLKAPHVTTPTKLTLNLSMGSKDRIISASMDFLVSPKLKERHARSRLFFYDPGGHFDSLSTFRTLRKKIQFNSSPTETVSDDERILISSTCDERVNHHLLIGGRALILADKIGTLKVGETAYTVETLEDNWIPGYNTILKKELFSQLPIETPMSWSYARVSPNLIIRNILPEDTEKIHVSYFQGWLHNFGATILKERTRRGGFAFVTTLNFEEYGKDPVATVLFENLLASLQGPQSN